MPKTALRWMVAKDNQLAVTMRQLRVLELDAAGFKDKEIAQTLGVSQRTVCNDLHYVRQIMGADPDIQSERRAQSVFRGLADRALAKNLAEGNPAVTIAYHKGRGVWREHFKDDTAPTVDPDELANLIKQAIESEDGGPSGVSPTDETDA